MMIGLNRSVTDSGGINRMRGMKVRKKRISLRENGVLLTELVLLEFS